MRRPLLTAATASALLLAALPAMAQTTEAQFHATTLNLSAEGETLAAPDMATITLGVQSTAATASGAMQANSANMNTVVAAIRRAGLQDRDIQTSGLSLNAQYAYENNQPPRLTGYQASNTVTLRVRDLTRLGPIVDATVNAGVNQINGISFGLQNSDAAEDAARQDAVKSLAARAELYARASGYRVGRLVNLSENSVIAPQPPMPMMAMARADFAGKATPVEGGELSIRVNVNAVYELIR